jgi:hypothetical protein
VSINFLRNCNNTNNVISNNAFSRKNDPTQPIEDLFFNDGCDPILLPSFELKPIKNPTNEEFIAKKVILKLSCFKTIKEMWEDNHCDFEKTASDVKDLVEYMPMKKRIQAVKSNNWEVIWKDNDELMALARNNKYLNLLYFFEKNLQDNIKNQIKSLSEVREKVVFLREWLSKNPDWFFLQETLNLESNEKTLLAIPSEVNYFPNLKVLSLVNHYIKDIPPHVFKLKNLEDLRLSKNLIFKIPKDIRDLKNLKSLNLRYNELTNVPESIRNLNLETLYLEGNQITELPKWFNKNLKLQNLLTCTDNNPIPLPPARKESCCSLM